MFIKVWKRVGAVAVYSPARAGLVALALVALVAVPAFFGGRASSSDKVVTVTRTDTQTQTSAPAADSSPTPVAAAPNPGAAKRVARGSYRRGYRAGARASSPGGAGFFKPGEAYLLKIEPGRNGAPWTVGPHVKVDLGFSYRLCRGGTTVCVRPMTASDPTGSAGLRTEQAAAGGAPNPGPR